MGSVKPNPRLVGPLGMLGMLNKLTKLDSSMEKVMDNEDNDEVSWQGKTKKKREEKTNKVKNSPNRWDKCQNELNTTAALTNHKQMLPCSKLKSHVHQSPEFDTKSVICQNGENCVFQKEKRCRFKHHNQTNSSLSKDYNLNITELIKSKPKPKNPLVDRKETEKVKTTETKTGNKTNSPEITLKTELVRCNSCFFPFLSLQLISGPSLPNSSTTCTSCRLATLAGRKVLVL